MYLSVLVVRLVLSLALQILYSSAVPSPFHKNHGKNNVEEYLAHSLESMLSLQEKSRVINLFPEFIESRASDNLDRANSASDNDTLCDAQLASLASGLSSLELWALQMMDSSSKIPSGILVGNMRDFGVYDECISIQVEKETGLIRGRHCMYSLHLSAANLPIPITSTLSICLPATCNAQHVNRTLHEAIKMVSDQIPFNLGISDVLCSSVDPPPFETGEIVTIVILSIFLCFLIGCTICDIFIRVSSKENSRGVLNKICKFSFYTNAKRIFDTTVPRGNIPAVQGIRFFSLCWVVLGHEHVLPSLLTAMNLADAVKWMGSWSAVYILIAPFAVDTFFTLAGFLSSYLFIKEMRNGRPFNPIMLYIHRYIRLTPAFAAMILLSIYILPRMGSGALWESAMTTQRDMCMSGWWPMLLYVHNYVGDESMICLGHAWYLAVDMQLFWVSPFILYPLVKKPKIGLGILAVFVIASIVTPAIIAGENQFSTALITNGQDIAKVMDMMKNFYTTAYTRAGPWLLGIYLGYKVNSKTDVPSRRLMTLGWLLAALAFAFAFFSYRIFQSKEYEWYAPWEIFYAGFGRHIWAFGICWIIYASVRGYGGVIATFLSLPVFIPLGRLSYSIYLVHFVIQQMRANAARAPSYFSEESIIYSFFGEFITSIIAGLALSLVFESPFVVLEKMIFGGSDRSSHQSREILADTEANVGVDNPSCHTNKCKNLSNSVVN